MQTDKLWSTLGNLLFYFLGALYFVISLTGCGSNVFQPSPFQPVSTYFECSMASNNRIDIQAQITNTTAYTMIVEPVSQFTFYDRADGHILDLNLNYFSSNLDKTIEIAPNQTVSMSIKGLSCGSCYQIGAEYVLTEGKEKGVMYTDEFQVGEIYGSQCVDHSFDRVSAIQVPKDLPFSDLEVTANTTVWVFPYCFPFPSLKEINHATLMEYPYATLEFQTSGGGWEIVVPSLSSCEYNPTYFPVPSGINRIDVWKGARFNWKSLESGWYRWHIVYWVPEPHLRSDAGLILGANYHIFSEAFYIRP